MEASQRAHSYRRPVIYTTRLSRRATVALVALALGGLLPTYARVSGLGVWTVAAAAQQSAASTVDAQPAQFFSGGATLAGYRAAPKTPGKHPAVLLIHDDMALNDAIRSHARLFAQAGFVAFAPDLTSRSRAGAAGSAAAERAGEGGPRRRTPVMGLPVAQTVDDVKAAFAFLQQDASVDAAKISAVGLGWGGYRVWRLAQQTPTLYRAVVFYGTTPTDDQIAKITTPIQAHYAQYDFLLTATALKTQKQLGKKFTYYIYPADRGFMGGSTGAAIDLTALTGEGDLPGSGAPAGGPVAAPVPKTGGSSVIKQAFDRTIAFLKG